MPFVSNRCSHSHNALTWSWGGKKSLKIRWILRGSKRIKCNHRKTTGMEKQLLSQWTLKTSFRTEISSPNTFSLVLFKVLTPVQHQSKRKCHYTYWLFCQKSQQIQETWISYSTGWTYKMNLPTENDGTAVPCQLQRTWQISLLLRRQL